MSATGKKALGAATKTSQARKASQPYPVYQWPDCHLEDDAGKFEFSFNFLAFV